MAIRQGESLSRALSPDDVGSAKELAANTVRLPPCLLLARPPQRRRYFARRTRRPPDGPDIMPFLPATRWLALALGAAAGCWLLLAAACPSLPLRRPSPSHDAVAAADTLRRGFPHCRAQEGRNCLPRRPCGLSTHPLAHAPTHHPPAPALLLPAYPLSSLANHIVPTNPLPSTSYHQHQQHHHTPCSPPTNFSLRP
jgi:hypothetical protein